LNTILLLEDDPNLAKSLKRYLETCGYSVTWAKNGEEAVDLSYEKRYELYLLDVNVPLLSGTELLSALRDAHDHTPAILISAQIDTDAISKGFMSGADDYIKKPFDPEELLIRIKAKTNRLKKRLLFGNIEIVLEKAEIFKDGEALSLGSVQKGILMTLARNYPSPVTKEELMLLLDKPTDLALRVNISKIKKALNIDIKSVRGVGYQII